VKTPFSDPYGFPIYHWRSFRKVSPTIRRRLRHPSRVTFAGVMASSSIASCLWWWCSDVGLSILWRPYCWTRRHHTPHHCDAYFEQCVLCAKPLWSRRRNGYPNPYRNTDRAPLRRLRQTPEPSDHRGGGQ
jgi:hypothetical protein